MRDDTDDGGGGARDRCGCSGGGGGRGGGVERLCVTYVGPCTCTHTYAYIDPSAASSALLSLAQVSITAARYDPLPLNLLLLGVVFVYRRGIIHTRPLCHGSESAGVVCLYERRRKEGRG